MPPLMNIFEPLSTHLSPLFTARVWIAEMSEPPEGSVMQIDISFLPASTSGAMRRFISSVPSLMIGASATLWISSAGCRPLAPVRASSSVLTRP